ncbi:hypothetical protein BC829DRAFT_487842 [Chytridium lagenaria]|nr:hypothetical protein BC829DRAFT_487842 [Chytridium lagenaria]
MPATFAPLTIALDHEAFKATMIATAILVLKFIITVSIQGSTRFGAGSRPPEDDVFDMFTEEWSKGAKQSFGVMTGKTEDKIRKEKLIEIRWSRIVMNDVENIPIGLIVAWATLLSPASAYLQSMIVYLFAISRVCHTIVYAGGMQPHRSITYIAGWVAITAMMANGIAGAYGFKVSIL